MRQNVARVKVFDVTTRNDQKSYSSRQLSLFWVKPKRGSVITMPPATYRGLFTSLAKMSQIIATYSVPELQMILFIFEGLDRSEQHRSYLQENQKQMECFEHTGLYEDHTEPKVPEQWTGSLISTRDFLELLKDTQSKEIKCPNQACNDLDKLSLLSIRAVAPAVPCSDPYHSVKFLTFVPEDDVIEVFI